MLLPLKAPVTTLRNGCRRRRDPSPRRARGEGVSGHLFTLGGRHGHAAFAPGRQPKTRSAFGCQPSGTLAAAMNCRRRRTGFELMEQALAQVFGSNPPLSAAQECARAVLVFADGLLLVRLAGRRVFGKWSGARHHRLDHRRVEPQPRADGSAPLWGTLAATTLLMALHWVLAHASAPWPAVSHVLEGRPIALAEANRLDEAEVERRERGRSQRSLETIRAVKPGAGRARHARAERTHYRAEARPMTT